MTITLGRVEVQLDDLQQNGSLKVLVPITATSENPALLASGFNLNIDVGDDGPGFPVGVSLGSSHVTGPSLDTWTTPGYTAPPVGLAESDIIVDSSSDVEELSLTGGVLLFSIEVMLDQTIGNFQVGDVIHLTFPPESGGGLPLFTYTTDMNEEPSFDRGSITIVPEPNAAMLMLVVGLSLSVRSLFARIRTALNR